MAIKIKQKEDIYELELEQENCEFKNKYEMFDTLQKLLKLKDKYGRIKKDEIPKTLNYKFIEDNFVTTRKELERFK